MGGPYALARMTRVADEPHLRADARRNRDALLVAAEEVFAEEGLGAPLYEIARRAGVGQGTLYRRFPAREALIEAIVDKHRAELAAVARLAGDGPEAFLVFFRAAVRRNGENRGLLDVLATHPLPAPELLARRASFSASFAPLLKRAQEAGLVRADLVPGDVRLLLAMVAAGGRRADAGSDPERALEFVLDSMRPGG